MTDFISIGANGEDDKSPVVSQLVTVTLSKEDERVYNTTYLPKRTSYFIPVSDELSQLSARFSGYMAFLRYTLNNARRLASRPADEVRTILNKEAERIMQNVMAVAGIKKGSVEYLENMQQGSPFIIAKVKDGYDVNFIGDSISTPKSCLVAYHENSVANVSIARLSESQVYKTDKLEAYSTEISLGAVRAGRQVLETIFGATITDAKEAGGRKFATLPLNFDFESLDNVFFDKTGIAIGVSFFKNVSQNIVRQFEHSTRITMIRSPNMEFIRILERMNPGYDMSEHITEEGLALSQVVSFAMTMHISDKLAQFICQAEENEKVSYAYLSTWTSLWTRRYMRPMNFRSKGGRIKRNDMPLFIVPLSKVKKTTDIRRLNNYAVEPGKGDANNIYIGSDGGLHYGLPTSLRSSVEGNLDEYESTMDEFFEHCYTNGLTASQRALSNADSLIVGHNREFQDDLDNRRNKVNSFAGKALTFDWDYGVSITVGIEDPTNAVTTRIEGSARIDDLTIADYLGFNFAQEGDKPIQKTFADSLSLMLNTTVPADETTASVVGTNKFIAENEPTGKLIAFYNTCMDAGLVPQIDVLIKQAAEALGIKELDTAPYGQKGVYGAIIGNDLRILIASVKYVIPQLLKQTLDYCAGSYRLRDFIAHEMGSTDSEAVDQEMLDHPIYFDATKSRMRDFGNLYNTLGGKVFQLACAALTDIPHDKMFVGTHTDKFNYKLLTTSILPQAVMFSQYIPRADEIFSKAEQDSEINKPDPSVTAEDIKVPGSVAGAQFFPHQVRTHGSLRKRPPFAIMDIRPGGGKTMLGLSDIASLIAELDELGESIRPVIICPENLIVNWVNDMKTMTGSKWNLIPITGPIVDRWGYDKIEALVNEAPKNTITAVSMNFATSRAEDIVLGTVKIRVSNNLELLKRLKFDYIVIDESQKLANRNSRRHKNIKQLTTASHVKYLRLASGTFIHGRVSDAIGQVSLYNGHIFREGDVLTGRESDTSVDMNGEDIPIWKVDTPARARTKLARYASIVTLQKKHWAFMLPSPIETFFAIPLVPRDDDTDATPEDRELGELHRQLYDTVLNESIEKLTELAKTAKATRASSEDDDDEDEGEETDGEEMSEEEAEEHMDFDLDEGELQGLNAADLEPFIARLERIITNPMTDPLAPTIFGMAGHKKYNSSLARFVAKRIDSHFNPEPWQKGKTYLEYSLVSHLGKLWLAKKKSTGTKFVELPLDSKGKEPNTASEYWREEPKGKIIVFCRYLDSVDGVYEALPAKYKNIAVKYSGREANKLANLDAFKNDERVQILVANEMGISEGHNLQLASRIIRVESPWNPGDLDQTASRIFRPDPAASKAMRDTGRKGELYREVVFLDWVVCDGTLHVQKQARLIAKVFNKFRFDEVGNPNYEHILEEFDLPEIPMSLDVLRSRSTLDEYDYYRRAYAALDAAQAKEFHDMRMAQDPSMQDLPQTPLLPGMSKINTPFISNQRPDDDAGLGLVSLRNIFRDPSIVANLNNIKGLPAVTDLGNGRIAKFRPRYKYQMRLNEDGKAQMDANGKVIKDLVLDDNGNKVINEMDPVSSITVKLTNGEMVTLKDPGLLFIATKLSKAAEKDFVVRNLDLTDAQERKLVEREARESEREDARQLEDQKRLRREQRQAADRKAAAEDGKKRKTNIQRGKPINAGIRKVKDVPPLPAGSQRVKDVPPIGPVDEDNEITVHPEYYHGYLALEITSGEPDAALLKKLKFREVASYAYVRALRYSQFEKIADYLEEHFNLSNQSMNRLDEIQIAFEHGGKELYKMELAASSTLPLFFATSQRIVTDRKEVKPYPIIMPNEMRLAIDIAACPAIAKHIGKAIPGASTKWTQHPGHYFYFAINKQDMKAKIKEIEEKGLVVTNKREALDEITAIKFKAARSK